MSFAHGDGERMKLVEELRLRGRRIVGKGAAREIGERIIGDPASACGRRKKPVPLGDAAQIFIGHWHGMAQRVQQDRVRGFRTDAGQRQKPSAQLRVGVAARASSDPPNSLSSIATKALSAAALRVKNPDGRISRRSFARGSRAQAIERQRAGRAQIGERAFDRLPCGVLREIGAKDHFQRRFGRPPVLRSVRAHQIDRACGAGACRQDRADERVSRLMFRIRAKGTPSLHAVHASSRPHT